MMLKNGIETHRFAEVVIPDNEGRVLLVKRGGAEENAWGLPYAHVGGDETAETAARRVAGELLGSVPPMVRHIGGVVLAGSEGSGPLLLQRERFAVQLGDDSPVPVANSESARYVALANASDEIMLELAPDAQLLGEHLKNGRVRLQNVV